MSQAHVAEQVKFIAARRGLAVTHSLTRTLYPQTWQSEKFDLTAQLERARTSAAAAKSEADSAKKTLSEREQTLETLKTELNQARANSRVQQQKDRNSVASPSGSSAAGAATPSAAAAANSSSSPQNVRQGRSEEEAFCLARLTSSALLPQPPPFFQGVSSAIAFALGGLVAVVGMMLYSFTS